MKKPIPIKSLFGNDENEIKYDKHIGIGKFGQAITFSDKKWSAHAGNEESATLFKALSRQYPNIKFYLFSRSDFSKLSLIEQKLYPNIVDIWRQFPAVKQDDKASYYEWPLNYFDAYKIKLDTCIFYNGPTGTLNVPDMSYLMRSDNFGKTLDMFTKYSAPLIHFLNITKMKYILLSPDSRYVPIAAMDLHNQPTIHLAQWQGEVEIRHYIAYKNKEIYTGTQSILYGEIEKCYLIGRTKCEYAPKTSNIFNIILNESLTSVIDRGKELEKYVLNDDFKDINIYGRWKTQKYLDDSRFKGTVHINDIPKILKDTKYTFLIPMKKDWISPKFFEMCNIGIIPFLHPSYNSQNTIKDLPKFLTIENSDDLKRKIRFLEEHPDQYLKLYDKMYALLKDEYFTEDYLCSKIMNHVENL